MENRIELRATRPQAVVQDNPEGDGHIHEDQTQGESQRPDEQDVVGAPDRRAGETDSDHHDLHVDRGHRCVVPRVNHGELLGKRPGSYHGEPHSDGRVESAKCGGET